MSDNIPFDMQMEIIKRVPDVKYLIRFRAVSKPWKSFIDSSEFITCYGARCSQPHHLLLRYEKANESPRADDNQLLLITKIDRVDHARLEQTSGVAPRADPRCIHPIQTIRMRQSQLTYFFEETCDTSTRCRNSTPEIAEQSKDGLAPSHDHPHHFPHVKSSLDDNNNEDAKVPE
nr:hypothetical protein [Tanacetum cinerariifolium]